MEFTTERFMVVDIQGPNGSWTQRIPGGITFRVDPNCTMGLDMSGRCVSERVYEQYFKPEEAPEEPEEE